jgi:membrane-associated HD superfamily phosphohydrolase
LHGWAKATGYYKTKTSKRLATIIVVLYHIAVITAIGIYATGMSNSGQTMAEAGILLLLVLLLLQVAVFIIMMCTSATQSLRPLLFAIAISLLLLKIRLLYQVVAVFLKYNMVTGSIALRVIFQFLPGAFILLVLVTGGVMSAGKQKEIYEEVRSDIPLEPQGSGNGSA